MFQLRGSRSACRPPNGPQKNIRQKGPNYDRTMIPQQQMRRGREREGETKWEKIIGKKEIYIHILYNVKHFELPLCIKYAILYK